MDRSVGEREIRAAGVRRPQVKHIALVIETARHERVVAEWSRAGRDEFAEVFGNQLGIETVSPPSRLANAGIIESAE